MPSPPTPSPRFAWKPSLRIGVPQIDAQHEALFERAARLDAAFLAGEPNKRLEELFAFLAGYVLEHFVDEEQLMRKMGYPRFGSHVQEHADFKRRLRSLVPQWDAEGESQALLTALLGFLDSWLTEHVSKSDQAIGEFARNRGE